jgi:hypothetical protein
MIYTNLKYNLFPGTKEINGINVEINGITSFVPLDQNNTDYTNIMKLVESGDLIIAPAEEPTSK